MKTVLLPGCLLFPTLIYPKTELNTFGGFLELRNDRDSGRHLGIDVSVKSGTLVVAPCKCTVFDVFMDPSTNRGWGGRVILKLKENYLILGHLKQSGLPIIGDVLCQGSIVGYIGDDSENGTWFCHLHIQIVTQLFIDLFENDLENLDGYCHDPDEDVSMLVKDPSYLFEQSD